MSVGVENIRKVLKDALEAVNAIERLRKEDYSALPAEAYDMTEEEALLLATDLQLLDLNDQELENKIETIALVGSKYVAFVLRLLKLVIPKQP